MCLFRKLAGILFLIFPILIFPQDSEIEKLEQSAVSLFRISDSLFNQLAELATESEIITQRIQMYQKVESLNPRQHRNLGKQMRNAQTLEVKQYEIQSSFKEATEQFRHVVQQLIQKIDLESDSLANLQLSGPQRKDQVAKRLQYLVNKKQQWVQIIEPVIRGEMPAFTIRANQWDSTEKLAIKGDLLLDQEERLKQEVQRVDKRIKSLEDEKRIRTRVSELASSMDIFNEEEELMNQLPLNGAGTNNFAYWNGENLDVANNQSYRSTKSANLEGMGLTPFDDILSTSENEKNMARTPETIQRSIDHLKQFRDRMNIQADSLNQRAKWFHQEAEKNQRMKTD